MYNLNDMSRKKMYEVPQEQSDKIIIEINPFDIERKVRKPLPPPSRFHKDKSKYERKSKHKGEYGYDE